MSAHFVTAYFLSYYLCCYLSIVYHFVWTYHSCKNPLQVSKEDDLPKKICDGCLYKLELLYQFWNTTVNAEKQLLTWLSQAGVDSAKKVTDAAMAVVSEAQEGADLAGGIILKQEAIDPAETRGDSGAAETISSEAQSYILQQQQLPYQPFAYGQVGMEGLAGEVSRKKCRFT